MNKKKPKKTYRASLLHYFCFLSSPSLALCFSTESPLTNPPTAPASTGLSMTPLMKGGHWEDEVSPLTIETVLKVESKL